MKIPKFQQKEVKETSTLYNFFGKKGFKKMNKRKINYLNIF